MIYNASEGGLIKSLKAHKDSVLCLAPLLGDGFASGGADKQVIIWSSAFQGILKYSHNDTIQSLSQNPITGVLLSCTHSEFGLWTPDVKALPKTKVFLKNKNRLAKFDVLFPLGDWKNSVVCLVIRWATLCPGFV